MKPHFERLLPRAALLPRPRVTIRRTRRRPGRPGRAADLRMRRSSLRSLLSSFLRREPRTDLRVLATTASSAPARSGVRAILPPSISPGDPADGARDSVHSAGPGDVEAQRRTRSAGRRQGRRGRKDREAVTSGPAKDGARTGMISAGSGAEVSDRLSGSGSEACGGGGAWRDSGSAAAGVPRRDVTGDACARATEPCPSNRYPGTFPRLACVTSRDRSRHAYGTLNTSKSGAARRGRPRAPETKNLFERRSVREWRKSSRVSGSCTSKGLDRRNCRRALTAGTERRIVRLLDTRPASGHGPRAGGMRRKGLGLLDSHCCGDMLGRGHPSPRRGGSMDLNAGRLSRASGVTCG
jgi:hypothetical protein